MTIDPMLGENLINYSSNILDGKIWRMSEKIDGVRRLFHKDIHGDITVFSRSGRIDPWLGHITDFLKDSRYPVNTVYDTELVDRELYLKRVPSFLLRTETNAKASQQYPDNKKDLMAVCFDIFRPDGDIREAWERDEALYSMFNRCLNDDPMVRVPIFGNLNGADTTVLNGVMDSVLHTNGEGIMLLDINSLYISGRSKNLLKVKRTQDFIGKIIDVEKAREGTKIEGMISAVICEVPGCTVPVRVGSGFNNQERMYMADISPIGREIEIDAFSYSKNRGGGVSLNLPIFKRFL